MPFSGKTFVWTGAFGTTNYTDPNWSDGVPADGNGPPQNSDDATINGGNAVTNPTGQAAVAYDLLIDNGSLDSNGGSVSLQDTLVVGATDTNLGGNAVNSVLTVEDGSLFEANLSGDAQTNNADAAAVGRDAGSGGSITIDGGNGGATLSAHGTIVAGINGFGEIFLFNGGALIAHEYPTGVSGIGQFAGSFGEISVQSGSSYTDDDLKVGDAGAGILYVAGNSTVVLGNDLAIGVQAGSNGTVQVGDVDLDPDTSTLTVANINVGGDFSGAGGTGVLEVESQAQVTVADGTGTGILNVWGGASGIGTVDLYNLFSSADSTASGVLAVGAFVNGQDASLFPGDLVLNPGGTLNLDNGVIEGGTLFFNFGTFNVTPALDQIDDQHSVLQDVTIEGQDLTVSGAVLTLADSTNGEVVGEGGPDNVLINATGSLIDLREDGGPYDLSQIINATDIALTVDASAPAVFALALSSSVVGGGGPNFVIEQTGAIFGTGAIFSDYTSPSSGGFFSGDVSLLNHGLIQAEYNDQSLDNSAQLSILTNTITNAPDGTFAVEAGATLNIGNSTTPLDANHVFTNLVDNGDGTTSLVDGAFVADAGNIDINGSDLSGNPLNPISTLSAVVYLIGEQEFVGSVLGNVSGDIFVNGTDIESTLTTITPSANGEGNLVLINSNTTWNTVEIQGLTSTEPTSWNIGGVHTFGQGGGLDLANATFNATSLTIDAANPADPGSLPAYILGDGSIFAPVTMNGVATTFDYGDGNSSLAFFGAVTGSGLYQINGATLLWFDQTLGLGEPVSDNTVNFLPNTVFNGASLWISPSDVTDDFRATITNFGPNDDIDLLHVHATSATFDSSNDVLSLFDVKGHVVATLQLDNTISPDQTFSVSPFGGSDGGTTIREGNPSFAPVLSAPADGTVTDDNIGPPVEHAAPLTLTFGDSQNIPYLDTLRIEGDPPLGSLDVTGGPFTLANNFGPVLLQDGSGTINLSYVVSDSAIDFLSAGETRTDTFDIEFSDSQATTVQPYSVTITGTNHAPVIGNVDLSTTGFSLAGSAFVSAAAHPDDTTGGNLYQLLPADTSIPASPPPPSDDLGQVGAIWQQVNLTANFTVHAELFFGTSIFNSFEGGSADGIAFALQHTSSTAVGDSGQGMGINGVADALGVKFDTFNNGAPELAGATSFSQFFTNGDIETPPTANPDQFDTGSLANGSWHDVVVSWNAATDQLTYTLDGTITDTMTEDVSAFGSSAFAGFTSASGSAFAPDQVEIVSFTNGTDPVTDFQGGVTDIAGLTTAQVATAGNLTASGTFDFSDVNQLDTHSGPLTPLTNSTIVSAPSYYTGGTSGLGALSASVIHDTTGTGNGGQVTWNFSVADSAVAFLHAGDQIVETFSLPVSDNHGGTTDQTITITITGSNNNATITATTPGSDQGSVTQFTSLTTSGSLSVTDPDSGQSAFQPETNVADSYGTFSITSTGAWSFTLNDSDPAVQALHPGQTVHDDITTTSADGTATHTVDVAITGNDNPPVANADSYTTHFATTLTESAANGVLANDTDTPDGHTLNAVLVGPGPADGSLTLNSDGSFTYTPNGHFVGTDSFQYEAVDSVDSQLVSSPATVTIHLTDTAPVAVAQTYSEQLGSVNVGGVNTGSPLTENAANGVLHGATDADGDPLTATLATSPSHGSVALNSDGSFTYTPLLGFIGTDSFTFKAFDGAESSAAQTASITVNEGSSTYDFSSVSQAENVTLGNTAGSSTWALSSNAHSVQHLSGLINNVVAGPGNNTITGNSNGDILIGGSGNDTIKGGTGNDIIIGGNGTNVMSGGGGDNTFVFASGGSLTDTISDFKPGVDVLDFQGFAGLTAAQIYNNDTTQGATGAVINIGTEHITLTGVNASQLANLHSFELNV